MISRCCHHCPHGFSTCATRGTRAATRSLPFAARRFAAARGWGSGLPWLASSATYLSTSGVLTITPLDYRIGGHIDGSVRAEVAGGNGKTPINGKITLELHAEFAK